MGEAEVAAGAASAAEAARTGASERGAAVRAAGGLDEASVGEGGAAVVDSSDGAVGAAGPRSATERSEGGGDGGGVGDVDGDDVDWEDAGAVVVGSWLSAAVGPVVGPPLSTGVDDGEVGVDDSAAEAATPKGVVWGAAERADVGGDGA